MAAMWLLVRHDPHPALDREAFGLLATTPRTFIGGHAEDLATLATVVAVAVSAATVLALVWRRRRSDAVVIALSYPLMLAVGYALKAIIARPRPAHGLLLAAGYTFPSTDAAVSIGIVAAIVALAGLIGDRRWSWALIVASSLAAVAVGALLIALRVHYLTDVIAGWGLGLSSVATAALGCGATASYRSRTRLSRASRSSH